MLSQVESELAAEWHASNSEISWQLFDSDIETRLKAIRNVEPEQGGIIVLAEIVNRDPDSVARVAALEQISDSESFVAMKAILRELQNPDSEVVMTALEIVEDMDDLELIPEYLEPLRKHPDPDVRNRVDEAIRIVE